MANECSSHGCSRKPCFGLEGSKNREFCSQHAKQGMVNISNSKKCDNEGCTMLSTFGVEGSDERGFCRQHAKQSMVNVYPKICAKKGCNKHSCYDMGRSGRLRDLCPLHANPAAFKDAICTWANHGCASGLSYMSYGLESGGRPYTQHGNQVTTRSVRSKVCANPYCTRWPSYSSIGGARKREFCARHARRGMIHAVSKKRMAYGPERCPVYVTGNARSKVCADQRCTRWPSYGGAESARKREFCAQHARQGMVHAMSGKRVKQGRNNSPSSGVPSSEETECIRWPSYVVEGARAREFYAQHVKQGVVHGGSSQHVEQGASKSPRYAVERSKKTEGCAAQHAPRGTVGIIHNNNNNNNNNNRDGTLQGCSTASSLFCGVGNEAQERWVQYVGGQLAGMVGGSSFKASRGGWIECRRGSALVNGTGGRVNVTGSETADRVEHYFTETNSPDASGSGGGLPRLRAHPNDTAMMAPDAARASFSGIRRLWHGSSARPDLTATPAVAIPASERGGLSAKSTASGVEAATSSAGVVEPVSSPETLVAVKIEERDITSA